MRIRRGELTDLYVEGERSVVMVGETVLVLSEIATSIVTAVPDVHSVRIEAVTAAVVAAFGEPDPPASAAELTLQQVHDLAAHDVLVIQDDPATEGVMGVSEGNGEATSEAARDAAVNALRGALRHLRSDAAVDWTPPRGVRADTLVAAAHQHHVVPFVAAGLDRLALPSRNASELRVAASRARAGAEVLAADLARAIDVLDAVGVKALAFKGIALAAQAYGDFAARGAGDLDILIGPSDLERAHSALSRAGWEPSVEYPSPGASWGWRHFARTDNELPLTGPRTMIDLHWHLTPIRGTFPAFETLWSRHEMVNVNGHLVRTLSPYDALAHSAAHAAKDRWRWLRSLLDVHHLATQRETWLGADRPLRDDQLITLGLASRILGLPESRPSVIDQAFEATDRLWGSVLAEQDATAEVHKAPRVPGHNFVRNVGTTTRTGGAPREAVRLLGRSAMPPWLTALEPSPYAAFAMPRVLTRRAHELITKARRGGS